MRRLLITSICLFLVAYGFSQKMPLTNEQKAEIPARTIQSSGASGFSSYNSFTKLNATNDGVSADGNINYLASHGWNFNLNVSTPVSSRSQRVKPLTISGLSPGSSLSLGTQFISWGNGFEYDMNKYNAAITTLGLDPGHFNYDDLNAQQQKRFDQLSGITWGTAFYAGLKVGMVQQAFAYVADPVSFAAAEDSKTTFKGALTGGMLKQWGILAITFTHTSGYVAPDPVNFTIPVTSSGVQVEMNLSPSPPIHQNSEKLRFEYLSGGYSGSGIRINPNINVEFKQQYFSFEFPVYFLTSDKERTNFNGGIYAGYVSDKDFTFTTKNQNIGFGVFIGANFTNLFNQ